MLSNLLVKILYLGNILGIVDVTPETIVATNQNFPDTENFFLDLVDEYKQFKDEIKFVIQKSLGTFTIFIPAIFTLLLSFFPQIRPVR